MKRIEEELEKWHRCGKRAQFWWRSDDIALITARFEKLLEIREVTGIPIALATIPQKLSEECRTQIFKKSDIYIMQHGYSHQNYAQLPTERIELGGMRPIYEIFQEIEQGKEILSQQFDKQFLPIMVPPWHNIHPIVAYSLPEIGLEGISVKEFQKILLPRNFMRLNVHLDLVEWKPKAHFKGKENLINETVFYLKQLRNHEEKIPVLGLLTHHEYHDEVAFQFLKEFIELIKNHPASHWISPIAYMNQLNP